MKFYKCIEIDTSSTCTNWLQVEENQMFAQLTYAQANEMLIAIVGVLAIVFTVKSIKKLLGF